MGALSRMRTPMVEGIVGRPLARCDLAHSSLSVTAGLPLSAEATHKFILQTIISLLERMQNYAREMPSL